MSIPELQSASEKNTTLELKMISASDIKHTNVANKMDIYAVVSLTCDNIQEKQAAKTPIDFFGGSNPTWNHIIKFALDEEATRSTLKVKLFSHWLRDENDLYLGEVNVSVQDLLLSNPLETGGDSEVKQAKLVTYPVTIMETTKGTLSLSYRFKASSLSDFLYPSASDYSFAQPVYLITGQPVMNSPQFQPTVPKLTLVLVINSAKDITMGGTIGGRGIYAKVMMLRDETIIQDMIIILPLVPCLYNPRWDHEVKFSLNEKFVQEGRYILVVKILCYWSLETQQIVGEVKVPIQELSKLNPPAHPSINDYDDGNGMSLGTWDVKEKGTLSFTYKFLVEKAPQTFIAYPFQGASGYPILHPGAQAGPSMITGQPVMNSLQIPTAIPKLTLVLVIKAAEGITKTTIGCKGVYAVVTLLRDKTITQDMIILPLVACIYRNPRWDHEVKFSLNEKLVQEGRYTLGVKMMNVRADIREKIAGDIKVPIQELFELNPPAHPSIHDYDDGYGLSLVTRDVREKGTLSFAYKFFVEQATQSISMYPLQGASSYPNLHPGAHAGPSNGQPPIDMQSEAHT